MSSTEGKEEKPSDTRTLFYIDIWDQKYNPLETKGTVTHYDPTPWDINYCTAITQLWGRYHYLREKNERIQYYWDTIGSGTGERRNVKKQNTTLGLVFVVWIFQGSRHIFFHVAFKGCFTVPALCINACDFEVGPEMA